MPTPFKISSLVGKPVREHPALLARTANNLRLLTSPEKGTVYCPPEIKLDADGPALNIGTPLEDIIPYEEGKSGLFSLPSLTMLRCIDALARVENCPALLGRLAGMSFAEDLGLSQDFLDLPRFLQTFMEAGMPEFGIKHWSETPLFEYYLINHDLPVLMTLGWGLKQYEEDPDIPDQPFGAGNFNEGLSLLNRGLVRFDSVLAPSVLKNRPNARIMKLHLMNERTYISRSGEVSEDSNRTPISAFGRIARNDIWPFLPDAEMLEEILFGSDGWLRQSMFTPDLPLPFYEVAGLSPEASPDPLGLPGYSMALKKYKDQGDHDSIHVPGLQLTSVELTEARNPGIIAESPYEPGQVK